MGNNEIKFRVGIETKNFERTIKFIKEEIAAAQEYLGYLAPKINQEAYASYAKLLKMMNGAIKREIDIPDAGLEKIMKDIISTENSIAELISLQTTLKKTKGVSTETFENIQVVAESLENHLNVLLSKLYNRLPKAVEDIETMEELEIRKKYIEYEIKISSGDARKKLILELQKLNEIESQWKKEKEDFERPQRVEYIEQIQEQLKNSKGKELKIRLNLIGQNNIKKYIRELQKMLVSTDTLLSDDERKRIEEQIKSWERYSAVLRANRSVVGDVSAGFGYVGQTMQSLSGVVEGSAAGWLQYGANVANAIAQAIPQIAALVSANTAQATTGAVAQSQTVPFPLNIIALTASLAAVGAALASVPKFANGGIAYGPTLGLFGEYAGAKSNPEVVAPLDRLRSLMGLNQPTSGGGGEVKFRIEGRTLVGLMEKMERYDKRT